MVLSTPKLQCGQHELMKLYLNRICTVYASIVLAMISTSDVACTLGGKHTLSTKSPSASVATEDILSIRAMMQRVHDSGVNQSYEWRRIQLLQLKRLLKIHRNDFIAALYNDLGKSSTEANACELAQIECELNYLLSNLKTWMKPKAASSPALLAPAFMYQVPTPRIGPACLIFGPSNYPLSLSLQPVAGALAAGNPVVLKPSELAPETSRMLKKFCTEYFPPDVLFVAEGEANVAMQLLEHQWGLVFFTGSERVGKLVAEAAAKTLTPTVLELGGKCPCYVDQTIPDDVTQVANRIIWCKTLNAGRTCCSIDTLIVHESVVDKLIPKLVESMHVQFPQPLNETAFPRFLYRPHAERMVDLLKDIEMRCASTTTSNTRIICGSSEACDIDSGLIEPMIVLNPPLECRIMQEEIFGPILPLITVKSRDEAIEFIRNMPGTPLCLYVFSKSNAVFEQIHRACPAGSVVRNDGIVHISSPAISFGGLGSSGYGSYHGFYSFQTFSHLKPIMYRPCAPGFDFGMARYHPFGEMKAKVVDAVLKLPLFPVDFKWRVASVVIILSCLACFRDVLLSITIQDVVAFCAKLLSTELVNEQCHLSSS